jgi:hypothetical protein
MAFSAGLLALISLFTIVRHTCSCCSISKDLPKLNSPEISVAMKVNHFSTSALPARASRLIFETAVEIRSLTIGSIACMVELENAWANSRLLAACSFGSDMTKTPGGPTLSLAYLEGCQCQAHRHGVDMRMSNVRSSYHSDFRNPLPTRWIVFWLSRSLIETSFGEMRTIGPK